MLKPVGFLLVLALAASAADPASAAPRKRGRAPVRMAVERPSFGDAGVFSGVFSEFISLNGLNYQLSPDVKIYEIGLGLLPAGSRVWNRHVHVSGHQRGSLMVVEQIMVRPASSDGLGGRIIEVPAGTQPE